MKGRGQLDIRPVFSERLSAYIGPLDSGPIAEALGVSQTMLRSWMAGRNLPTLGNFTALVQHLDIAPADYFIGLCDLPPPPRTDGE